MPLSLSGSVHSPTPHGDWPPTAWSDRARAGPVRRRLLRVLRRGPRGRRRGRGETGTGVRLRRPPPPRVQVGRAEGADADRGGAGDGVGAGPDAPRRHGRERVLRVLPAGRGGRERGGEGGGGPGRHGDGAGRSPHADLAGEPRRGQPAGQRHGPPPPRSPTAKPRTPAQVASAWHCRRPGATTPTLACRRRFSAAEGSAGIRGARFVLRPPAGGLVGWGRANGRWGWGGGLR